MQDMTRTVRLTLADRMSEWLRRLNISRRRPFVHDVTRALALQPRGGVSRDALLLQSVSTCMSVTWTARPVHPWDRHLPNSEQEQGFAAQCLEDAVVAITRLFARFDAVESLEIDVLHPVSRATILTGRVSRADFLGTARMAIPMRLKMAGLAYEFGRGGLQPIPRRLDSTGLLTTSA
jgi:hypothetical protein